MSPREAPTRTEALLAYALAALSTLLWVACVLPAGEPAAEGTIGDDAVPLHRVAFLLVPALLLLIATPVGCTLARRERGMRVLLAVTDAFVALYVAVALWSHGFVPDLPATVAMVLLLVLGALSLAETVRTGRGGNAMPRPPEILAGARLAICILVLLAPLSLLVAKDAERASLLAPFLFVAVSSAGARLARSMRGLHRTGALVQLLLAAHILVTLRFTVYVGEPTLERVYPTGRVALGLAIAILVVALLQMAVYLRRGVPAAQRAGGATPLPTA